jgi:hypothetical protein
MTVSRTWGRGTDSVAAQSFEWRVDRFTLAESRQLGPNVNPRIATDIVQLAFLKNTVMVSRFAKGRNPLLLPE